MPDASPDEAFARYVLQTGMATPQQVEAARQLKPSDGTPTSLSEALLKLGIITAAQRETVERKIDEQRVQSLGPYRLIRKLGEGGMGAVYLAEDTGSRRKVALKVLLKTRAQNTEFLKRFRREAEAAVILDHPNIARAFAAAEDRGYHYYVMEYCDGESLRKRLDHEKFLPTREATRLVMQIALGLKYAHDHGFIHRDVKPENVIITKEGVAKLLDLGLSKNIESIDESFRTGTGMAVGTPHYISPEQARSMKDIDGRADIYSLGATYYHLVTGETPFRGSSVFEIINKHLTEQLPDPRDVNPGVPGGVAHVIRRMMAKKPDDRYRNCDELLVDLNLVLDEKAPSSPVLDATLSSVALRTSAGATTRAETVSSRPVLAAGAAAGALLAAVIAIVIVISLRGAKPPAVTGPKHIAAVPPVEQPTEPPKPPETREPDPLTAPPQPKTDTPTPPKTHVPPPPKTDSPPASSDPMPPPTPPVTEEPPPPDPPKPSGRGDVPSTGDIERAVRGVRERFKADYAQDSPELPTKLIAAAAEPGLEVPVLYALLLEARDTAAQDGDAALALRAVARLNELFVIDLVKAKVDALARLPVPRTQDSAALLCKVIAPVIEEALAEDRFEEISRLATKAEPIIVKAKNDEIPARLKRVQMVQKEFAGGASAILRRSPDDPAANLAMGRYTCFAKNDWARGLPMLAKGSDPVLRNLALKELREEKDGDTKLALCDGWLEQAKREETTLRRDNLATRAAALFDEIALQLDDKVRDGLQKRLAALGRLPYVLPDGRIDLLKLPNLNQDSVNGKWRFDGTVLVSPRGGGDGRDQNGPARLRIPYAPPDEYEIELVVERVVGIEDLLLAPVYEGRLFALALDGWGGSASGMYFRSQWAKNYLRGPVFTNNKRHTVLCSIRKNDGRVSVDGGQVLSWKAFEHLSLPDNMRMLSADGLILATVRSEFRVHSMKLKEITGRGKVLR